MKFPEISRSRNRETPGTAGTRVHSVGQRATLLCHRLRPQHRFPSTLSVHHHLLLDITFSSNSCPRKPGSGHPELIADFGRIAEERGFHSIWMPEHVVFFRDYASQYPYSDDGRIPGNPNGGTEPLTVLTFLAAHTERIRLGTGVCLVPQRNPIYTAKQVANVDYLSKGRLDFGIGIGWLREEFDALGVP